MAIIPLQRLFGWEQIEGLGDLERLMPVLNHLPDKRLMNYPDNSALLSSSFHGCRRRHRCLVRKEAWFGLR